MEKNLAKNREFAIMGYMDIISPRLSGQFYGKRRKNSGFEKRLHERNL